MVREVDYLDRQIIKQLQKDGRMTVKDIANNLDRRRATIHNRIKKMEEDKVIRGYTVIPDFSALGYQITVFILVTLNQEGYSAVDAPEELGEIFSELKYVTEVNSITGDFDYLLKARIPSLEDLGNKLNFPIRKLRGVGRTLTFATFASDKEELGTETMEFIDV